MYKKSAIFQSISECISKRKLNNLCEEFQKTKPKLEEEVTAAMTN
ncbi:hypothetical protein NIES2100_35760 [Calothrix sp. NIES-2100]|nr:hypothetical protein NIES2100_35760 [Calothrix sp. NIES-2100]